MIVIRTAENLERAIADPPDPDLAALLECHRDRLAEWDDYQLDELALFVIVQPGDCQDEVDLACGRALLSGADLADPPEFITEHAGWMEAVTVLSDDGFGLVLLVSKADGTPPDLLAACQRELARTGHPINP